ncbi:MAG TPA: chromate resistance protein ChrB domain-containing protein, partial [Gemmatimonadales bacterium]|nr:chromate resistance protein ChrB domain-containing protein [Gemmatimonadales bacterium]
RATERAVARLEARVQGAEPRPRSKGHAGRRAGRMHGRTWVTRRGVFVDRIASAWLIKRFIDPEARFKFVAPEGYVRRRGELRFDMFEAEYTHDGSRCTFETLVRRFELRAPALCAIGEIVHDIDCKDAKFGRAEAAGVAQLLGGIARGSAADATRLRRGGVVFDNLYESFVRSRHGSERRGSW